MSLLNYYDNRNKNMISGKTLRITCGAPTDPMITFTVIKDEPPSWSIDSWYEMICHSTASFEYVGMDLNTAKNCRDAMITKFTRTKSVWHFVDSGYDPTTKVFKAGWELMSTGATVQEAEVSLQHMGGHMYKVTVNVDCEDVTYTKNPSGTTFAYPACMSDID